MIIWKLAITYSLLQSMDIILYNCYAQYDGCYNSLSYMLLTTKTNLVTIVIHIQEVVHGRYI